MAKPERLQKFMARCGVASRREAESIILAGRVKVNKHIVTELCAQVDEDNDKVFLDGELIRPEKKLYYIMLNKPKGYITTAKDEFERKTVLELVTDIDARLYPVGRLDYDSEGLLLLTNDGDFANKLMHPKHEVEKTYETWVTGYTPGNLQALTSPMELDGYQLRIPKLKLLKVEGKTARILITIHEGRNRQGRRMCEIAGMHVTRLKRVKEGALELGDLPKGKWRYLNPDEVERMK